MKTYDFETSKAFVSRFNLSPLKSGVLSGLTFAVKDLIDISGVVTGCGNPTWLKTHPKAVVNAVCVDQLCSEGATCVGKTITDELAYGLMGENFFYGTPVNPEAPNRVPGGSSCGSASAVACGLIDFALGTDTAGSVRVPASNCGIWGYRPSYGQISMAGVNPLAPSFDTLGVFAKNSIILQKVMSVLMGLPIITNFPAPNIFFLKDIFEMCDSEIQKVFLPIKHTLKNNFSVQETTLKQITNEAIDYQWLFESYKVTHAVEIWSTLGAWVEATQPKFGPVAQSNFFDIAKVQDRSKIQINIEKRKWFSKRLQQFLEEMCLICFPTTPALAPELGTLGKDPTARAKDSDYYTRLIGINSISSLAGMPQVTIPIANVNGVPIGISLLALNGEDMFLIAACASIAATMT